MYSNLVLSRIGIRALLTTVLASLWECQPPAEQGNLSQMQCAISQFTSSSYLLSVSVSQRNQSTQCWPSKDLQSVESTFRRARALLGRTLRRLDWTGRSSLSPTAALRTSRELCVEGEDWESLAWLRASALLCLLIHCTFLEALAAACPSWQASCRESGHGRGTAVSRACPKASVSPPN